MKYLSSKEAADKWGISERRVQILCNQDRIAGVIRIGSTWAFPMTQRNQRMPGLSLVNILRPGTPKRAGHAK